MSAPKTLEVIWDDHHFSEDIFSPDDIKSRAVHQVATCGYYAGETRRQLAVAHSYEMNDGAVRFVEVTFIIKKCIVWRSDKHNDQKRPSLADPTSGTQSKPSKRPVAASYASPKSNSERSTTIK